MIRKLLILAITGLTITATAHAARPRLVVNIVLGSMRAEDLDRYAANFGEGGIRRLCEGGTRYTDATYNCQQTITPVSLATLITGAMPSTHGVIGMQWQDYVENKAISLTEDKQGYSPRNLIAPTLGETLLGISPDSRVVSIAAEAPSAVILAGKGGDAYWLDTQHCGWASSAYYAAELPDWIGNSNREKYNLSYLNTWRTLLPREKYVNSRSFDITYLNPKKKEDAPAKPRLTLDSDYDRLRYTPAGNTAVLGFAKQVIAQYKMGIDQTPDLLNISLDAAERIQEAYGPESVEAEDMYYRLDRDIADLLTFIYAQVKGGEVVVLFTAAHGTSPSFDAGREEVDRFNIRQFEVIANSFLNARYGTGNWVLEYENKCVYLNHNLIYERGLDLAAVQNEVAIFAMQFRGVSHALSASAMRTSYFGSGYAQKMQNSFYPRRSGDVILNLMPGWIELSERCWSASGSMYGYDTDVPLVFYGLGAVPQRIRRRVVMTDVAPTLAYLLDIREPAASEGTVLDEFF